MVILRRCKTLTISAALTEVVGGRKTVDHVEFTRARMKRDAEDLEKLVGFFKINNPFRFSDKARLVSLSSGTVANDGVGVNCDIAGDVGMQILQTWQDMNYSEIILRNNQTVKTLESVHNMMKLVMDLVKLTQTDCSNDLSLWHTPIILWTFSLSSIMS